MHKSKSLKVVDDENLMRIYDPDFATLEFYTYEDNLCFGS